jgi:hypothetical protein
MARKEMPEIAEPSVPETVRKSLFERVASYLDAADWDYTAHEDKNYFSLSCRLEMASVRIIIDVYDADDWHRLLASSIFPVFMPEHRREDVAMSLAKINYSLIYGNLEMDLKDGEVRFRTVVESDGELSEAMIERVLRGNLSAANRYLAPLLAVAFGNAAPETVLDLVAKESDATLQ